jgi:Dolichyl-phosphate-mannose-protein mannosyltransferase
MPVNATRACIVSGKLPVSIRMPLIVVVTAALLAGLYGRFKGLGIWPLGVDEFYISRSIDHVMQSGLPRFPCGGYYNRGLLYQYLVAGVRLLGLSPELAGRAVAAVCSVAVLPAVYLLGKRIQGSLAGWLIVIILCVSIWEIEMARFARMYAPFQAVFVWYLVFFLRHTIDKNGAALAWMIVFSVLGALTWEGGVLLGIANMLAILIAHERGRLKAADWGRLAGLLVLLVLLYVGGTNDWRGLAEGPAADPGEPGGAASQAVRFAAAWFAPLRQHLIWACGWLLALGLACQSLRWIGSYRERWLAAAGLCVALAAAAAHLFTVTVGIVALMLLTGLIDRRELTDRHARYFMLTLVSFLVFWLAFNHWVGGLPSASVDRSAAGAAAPPVIQHLFGFPDVYDAIIRPWGRTLPILSVGLALALVFLFAKALAARSESPDPIAVLLTVILVIVLVVGATPTGRIETRYTFFLYPLLIVLAVTALTTLINRLQVLRRAPIALCAAIPLLCFGATEDFQPNHLVAVDSADVNFRVGMSASRAAHYYPRNDMRVVGQWLATHVQSGDVVITGIPNLDQYYDGFDYFFLERGDSRYDAYVCHDGHTERWTNHPLLYTEDELKPIVGSGHRVFASVYPDTERHLWTTAQSQGWSVTRVWATIYGNTDVLLITTKSGAQQ